MGSVDYNIRTFYGFVVDLDQFVVDRVDEVTGDCSKWDYETWRRSDDKFCSECGKQKPKLGEPLALITTELDEMPDDNAMMKLCWDLAHNFDFDMDEHYGSYDWDTNVDIAENMWYRHEPRLIGESELFPGVYLQRLYRNQGVEHDSQYGHYDVPAYFGATIDHRRTYSFASKGNVIEETDLNMAELAEVVNQVDNFFEGVGVEPKLQSCLTASY